MKFLEDHLRVVFQGIQPELLLSGIRETQIVSPPSSFQINSRSISLPCYSHYARETFRRFSPDELENLHSRLTSDMTWPPASSSVFHLLHRYTESVLELWNEQPVCRFEQLPGWRRISLFLGQDLPVTAHMAWNDAAQSRRSGFFAWNTVLHSDNLRLHTMLAQGVSENHYHLNGSTQIFALSWACLMNHPELIPFFLKDRRIAQQFQENLNPGVMLGTVDNQLPWSERLVWAAWLRHLLFLRVVQKHQGTHPLAKIRCFENSLCKLSDLRHHIDCLRFSYYVPFRQPDGRNKCLDYALYLAQTNPDNGNHNRLLAGERALLYHCFYLWSKGELDAYEEDLFYLYLLLKAQFRAELIQVNQRVGFKNFALYQDRKGSFWDYIPQYREYWQEAQRLSINSAFQENSRLVSLEARIVPTTTPKEQVQAIRQIDTAVHYAWGQQKTCTDTTPYPYSFIIHYTKNKLQFSKDRWLETWRPRNWDTRKAARERTLALAEGLRHSEFLRKRIRGIDACAYEIGCRPETFACDFRYLRNHIFTETPAFSGRDASMSQVSLGATYHVGEDFLDLIDGLRAIDEAVNFLDLHRGDRIGHALALGVDPENHYRMKEFQIALPRQDLLDNLVWLLFQSEHFGISLGGDLRASLSSKAQILLDEIYLPNINFSYPVSLADYFWSWHLRGDEPQVCPIPASSANLTLTNGISCEFYRRPRLGSDALRIARSNQNARQLYQKYHFDPDVKLRGSVVETLSIEKTMIPLVRQLQNRMMDRLAETGISVECNPSSNVLIGTFRQYEIHPIFRFVPVRRSQDTEDRHLELQASVNTDDLGVFDTSLENEYMLLAATLSQKREADGTRMYQDEEIYQYLDRLRQAGNLQSFLAIDTYQKEAASGRLRTYECTPAISGNLQQPQHQICRDNIGRTKVFP